MIHFEVISWTWAELGVKKKKTVERFVLPLFRATHSLSTLDIKNKRRAVKLRFFTRNSLRTALFRLQKITDSSIASENFFPSQNNKKDWKTKSRCNFPSVWNNYISCLLCLASDITIQLSSKMRVRCHQRTIFTSFHIINISAFLFLLSRNHHQSRAGWIITFIRRKFLLKELVRSSVMGGVWNLVSKAVDEGWRKLFKFHLGLQD